ncbi:LysR family transcriptional regulator [uncultured Vibrio sp.]|uniref:LysR family transcriptional regulator n=1 Tax=uncultured Vibrio sp. TaxID=114054 RepID=UPI0025F21472|nr:LysR family transcriptional regulator [uncultured Vibrio sp.]
MLHFNLDQINAFATSATAGSFSKAAIILGKSRSTIHQQVSNLEIDLGLTLFKRSGKSLSLTNEGKMLLRRAKHLIYQAEHFQNSADSLVNKEESSLTIYHDAIFPLHIIRTANRWVKDAYPHINIHWLHRNRQTMYQALKEGSADLGLALNANATLPDSGVEFFNLGGLKVEVFARQGSSLSGKQPCTVDDFAFHTCITLEDYAGTQLYNRTQLSSNEMCVSNMDVLLGLLQEEGWAVLPSIIVENNPQREHLQKLALSFKPHASMVDYVIYSNKLETAGPALSLLIDSIKILFEESVSERKTIG